MNRLFRFILFADNYHILMSYIVAATIIYHPIRRPR